MVDVGIGTRPDTTCELALACRALDPNVPVVALEVDPQRLEHARAVGVPGVELLDWDPLADTLPAARMGFARLVRAMNLLRGRDVAAAERGQRHLGRLLVPGGRLIEGSSDSTGAVLCAHVMARGAAGLLRQSLLFFTDFSRGCGPFMFRDQLPADLRRSCRATHPVHGLLARWHRAFVDCGGHRLPVQRFQAAVAQTDGLWLPDPEGMPGLVEWRPPGGVPRADAVRPADGPADGAGQSVGGRRALDGVLLQ